MEKEMTIGERAKAAGFDSVLDHFNAFINAIEEAKNKLVKFNISDKVKLKTNLKPTHFNEERFLSLNTNYIIKEVSNIGLLVEYSVKLEGFDRWFDYKLFELV